MAVYNGMPWLTETLASLRGQTFTDFEVVLIDEQLKPHLTRWPCRPVSGPGRSGASINPNTARKPFGR